MTTEIQYTAEGNGTQPDARANARLIAAAPDMLAMLERTRDELEASGGFEGDENLFWAIVALIARATGEQS